MLKRLADIFKKETWEERFLVGKKKAEKLLEKLKKAGKTEFTTEALELMEFYGVPVADYQVVTTKADIYRVAEEMGLPVVVKTVASKAIHRWDAGAVYVVTEKRQIEEAYPQVLGEIATRMPWVALEGIMVQEFIPGEDKCWIKITREKKNSPFKVLWKRIVKGKEEKGEEELARREDMEKLPFEESFAGIFAFVLQFGEVQKMEADFVKGKEDWILVDSKVWLFE